MLLPRIRIRGDGQYVLGEEKPDEVVRIRASLLLPLVYIISSSSSSQPFATVVDLVNHHKRNPLVLKSGGDLKLLYECPS